MFAHKSIGGYDITLKTTYDKNIIKIRVLESSDEGSYASTKTIIKFDTEEEAEEAYRLMQYEEDVRDRLIAELM